MLYRCKGTSEGAQGARGQIGTARLQKSLFASLCRGVEEYVMGRIGRIALLFAIAASLLATALPASASSRSKMSSSEVAGRAKAIAAATFNASSPAEGQKIWRDGM